MNDRSDPDGQAFSLSLSRLLTTKTFGKPLHFFPSIDSTNTHAARLAREGATEGTAVIADEQTGGKGRLGRSWVSPPGVNLHLSLILRPPLATTLVPQINLLAAIAVANAIRDVSSLSPAIKWPNDVLLQGKKVCGILAEMQTETGTLRSVVLGIGVNVNAPLSAFPPELHDKASSLFLTGGQFIDRAVFTAALLTHLEKLYVLWLERGFLAVRPAWEHYAAGLIGQQITVAAPEGTITGVVLGLDSDGALLLQDEGTTRRILAGDVTVVGGYARGETS
ncbi:MAG TPA: biotin--[acetyl-CoA-carboxylase] ligase [Methylomirabilota bacterium]|nr:biotin--[acetyl-CoA-carboxylase] ligase [Methylomirabilota bacterium]